MTNPIEATDINQTDYLKLFMQELTYQDPLKPIDNREFMAQMAQFSTLQEARSGNALLSRLVGMTSANQGLELLGKKVKINNMEGEGTVTKVAFYEQAPPQITVAMSDGNTPKVDLSQVSEVWRPQ